MPEVAFISGHVDLLQSEFDQHYIPAINQAINNGNHYVLGNARGGDTMGLTYLLSQKVDPTHITIYVYDKYVSDYDNKKKYAHLDVNIKCGYQSYTSRDADMTTNSHYDIAWVRSKEASKVLYGDAYKPRVSGTQHNLNRRLKLNKSKLKST